MDQDTLHYLTQFKSYRERSVMMAARSLIGLFRQTMPDMLQKKDRGRPTEASIALEPLKYGEIAAKDFIPGAEVVTEAGAKGDMEIDSDDSEVRNFLLFQLYFVFLMIFNLSWNCDFRMMISG